MAESDASALGVEEYKEQLELMGIRTDGCMTKQDCVVRLLEVKAAIDAKDRAEAEALWMIQLPTKSQSYVLGPKYERQQRPRNSQEFRIGASPETPAKTSDVGGSHLPESLSGPCR